MSEEKAIDILINEMLRSPEDFTQTPYLLRKKNGVSIWIASGFWFYGVCDPIEIKFSFFERLKFHKAYKKWQGLYKRALFTKL